MKKQDIKNLSYDDLKSWLESNNIKPYRAEQIFKWIYIRQANSFEEMTDIGKELRKELNANFSMNRLQIAKVEKSTDGSRKILYQLEDMNYIESVLIPDKDRITLCVSSQVGCAKGCKFCLTATGGFIRNLTPSEIISQVRDTDYLLSSENNGQRVTNIVFMGMGEPLSNYKNLIKSLQVINDTDRGLKFSTRRVTVSTCGVVPRLNELGFDSNVNLAISLNATTDETRSYLMPINNKYNIETLIQTCKKYPLSPRQKITFEYILMKGVNDNEEDARRLAKILSKVKSKINLIPYNEHPKSDFKQPERIKIERFLKILLDKNYTAIIRKSKGRDISAACGQLGVKANKKQIES